MSDWLVILSLALIDQLTKAWALNQLTIVSNSGSGFGLGSQINWWLMVSSIILVGIGLFWFKQHWHFNLQERWALILILAGGLSNNFDRWQGGVVDFIDIKIWPMFNFSDVFICLGILLLIINYVKNRNSV